jgi:hypothetical protein
MRSRTVIVALELALAVSIVGCGDPDPNPNRPNPPAANDPAFSSRGLDSWYVLSDGVTPASDRVTAIITAPSGTDYVDAYIPGLPPIRMIEQDGEFAMDESIAGVGVGAHEVLFTANGSNKAFASHTLNRSAPYYVIVTTDFDFADPGVNSLNYIDRLHNDHPEVVMTHFWAPYTYTDAGVTEARKNELDTWLKKKRDDNGDEIGLHIHPYCHFVTSAGVTCITDQSTTMPAGDTSGYTIKLSAYGREPMVKLLERAKQLFNQRGLGTPLTFRAGGWTASIDTLRALDDAGFIADTSALNWSRIEEWQGYELYTWNMTNWNPMSDTAQPYRPSTTNAWTSDPGPTLSLLEVPDNGVMIDYVSTQEMIGLFDANWDGQPFESPRTLMMGFHPALGMSSGEYTRVNELLKHADEHLASRGTGPVVYITLEHVTPAFPAP